MNEVRHDPSTKSVLKLMQMSCIFCTCPLLHLLQSFSSMYIKCCYEFKSNLTLILGIFVFAPCFTLNQRCLNPNSAGPLSVSLVHGVKNNFFDFLKVYNELWKVKKFRPPDPFFHGEIAFWKKGARGGQ